jgi:MscS family membrane protein
LGLEITERSMSTVIAFGGVGGLGLAFASQDIIANLFAGLVIYATSPFTKGEWILIPDKNIEGIVDEIGWYMTRIKSMDKRPMYIPNAIFSKAVIVNPARMTHRQLKFNIGLRYSDMPVLKTVMKDIKSMLQAHPDIDRSFNLNVFFTSFGSYSLDVLISAYSNITQSDAFAGVKDDILFKISDIVTKHGAEMAFPTNVSLIEPLNAQNPT